MTLRCLSLATAVFGHYPRSLEDVAIDMAALIYVLK